MKKVEKVASGANFAAVTVGKTEELNQYALPLAPGVEIPGKVFVGGDLQATGAEMSFQQFAPGGSVGFLHTHKTHEELYIILGGDGEFQVDGQVFPVGEGSVIRVSPAGRRSLRPPDDDELHPVQSRLLRRGRRRRRRNPPRPGRLVGSPGSRLPAPGTTRQQSRKSAAPRIRQRRIIQEHRGKNAQIEPGTCPPMQSRPECTLRPAFLIFPQGYSSPSSGSATRIRPQYSQTISFLPWRISTWRCGGIRLKQPPQASRFTVTTASPLRTLLRMRP